MPWFLTTDTIARKTWYRTSLSDCRMLKMVVKMVNAMGGPFIGDEVMGCERLPQMRGRNMLMLGDCRTRWIRRLYV